jgi:hypothetical protein
MTLGGYWQPLSKVEITDFWGGRIHFNFFAYMEPQLFFAFGRENSPVQPLSAAAAFFGKKSPVCFLGL